MTINEDNFKDLNIGEQFNTFTIYSNNEADELKEDTSISSFGQLDIDNNRLIKNFDNVETQVISVPKLIISEI